MLSPYMLTLGPGWAPRAVLRVATPAPCTTPQRSVRQASSGHELCCRQAHVLERLLSPLLDVRGRVALGLAGHEPNECLLHHPSLSDAVRIDAEEPPPGAPKTLF